MTITACCMKTCQIRSAMPLPPNGPIWNTETGGVALLSLNPSSAPATGPVVVEISGFNFNHNATVLVAGVAVPTVYRSSLQVDATISPTGQGLASMRPVTVRVNGATPSNPPVSLPFTFIGT